MGQVTAGHDAEMTEQVFGLVAEGLGLSVFTRKYTSNVDEWNLFSERGRVHEFIGTYREAVLFVRGAAYAAGKARETIDRFKKSIDLAFAEVRL